LIHFLHGGARPARDAPLAAAAQNFRMMPLLLRHRTDDGLDAPHLTIGQFRRYIQLGPRHTGDHVQHLAERPHLFDLLELTEKVFQVKLGLEKLGRQFLGLLVVERRSASR